MVDDFEQIQAKEPSYPDPGNLQAQGFAGRCLRREDARAGAVKDKAQHKHGREEALEAQDRAIERKPNDPKKWKGKGQALYEIGRKEEALEAYDRALALKPYNGGSLNGKVWTLSKLSLQAQTLASTADRDIHILSWHNKA